MELLQVRTGGIRIQQETVLLSDCSMACVSDSETSQTTEVIFVDLIIDKSVKMFNIPLETVCPRLHLIPLLNFQFTLKHLSFPNSLYSEITTLEQTRSFI